MMRIVYDDGGRRAAGFRGRVEDCVARSIAIATRRPYKEVYDLINAYGAQERPVKGRGGARSDARVGVYPETIRAVMSHYGWLWVPQRGHLNDDELPGGRLVVLLAKHCTAVVDGVVHDTWDCTMGRTTRQVYGYYMRKGVKRREEVSTKGGCTAA